MPERVFLANLLERLIPSISLAVVAGGILLPAFKNFVIQKDIKIFYPASIETSDRLQRVFNRLMQGPATTLERRKNYGK